MAKPGICGRPIIMKPTIGCWVWQTDESEVAIRRNFNFIKLHKTLSCMHKHLEPLKRGGETNIGNLCRLFKLRRPRIRTEVAISAHTFRRGSRSLAPIPRDLSVALLTSRGMWRVNVRTIRNQDCQFPQPGGMIDTCTAETPLSRSTLGTKKG
jgi:hypothetical protein